jgi:hypothetical protein
MYVNLDENKNKKNFLLMLSIGDQSKLGSTRTANSKGRSS